MKRDSQPTDAEMTAAENLASDTADELMSILTSHATTEGAGARIGKVAARVASAAGRLVVLAGRWRPQKARRTAIKAPGRLGHGEKAAGRGGSGRGVA
jgi:hypothetical protein